MKFSKLHPLPAYEGPRPVYRCSFPWAGAVDCYVRRNGQIWETAEITTYVQNAQFSACPVAGASLTRAAACYGFDYYYNRQVAS